VNRIGAVVVSHQSARDLPVSLEALAKAEDLTMTVVVDNASEDDSAAVARRFAGPGVRVHESRRNLGFAGGCNLGYEILAKDCDWLAFLNPDVAVKPDCLSRCVAATESVDHLAGVAPLLMRPDGMTVDSVGQVLSRWRLEVHDRGYGQTLSPGLLGARPVMAPCGALAMYRTEALAEVTEGRGPWAQSYFCFWEDLELGWRLVNRKWEIVTVPEAVAVHGRGAGAVSGSGPLRWRRSPALEACIVTNRWMTLIRHLHPLDLIRRLPLLLAWDLTAVTAGAVRRPEMLRHLRLRWPLVMYEWRHRVARPRRRLSDLPC